MFAKSFSRSLQKLDGTFQNAAKATVTKYLMNPDTAGLNFEAVQRARDKNFYSVRVNQDVRIILYKRGDRVVFLHADHHDRAYDWARRHQLERNERTGAPQLVEIEEITRTVTNTIVEYKTHEVPLFRDHDDDYLLDLVVPPRLLSAVKHVTRSGLYELIDHLPEEAVERLMRLADGEVVIAPDQVDVENPFEHPDAKRRFRTVEDQGELERALDYPWEQWLVFLHPTQEELVHRDFSGPARVTGAAGTGKTVVALHRVARLHKRDTNAPIFLTTFSKALAARLEPKLELLLGDAAAWRDHITVSNLHKVARRLYTGRTGCDFQRVNDRELDRILEHAARDAGNVPFSARFLRAEWDGTVDALGITRWEEYRTVPRVGRGTPLGARQRKLVWKVFEGVYRELEATGRMTFEMLCHRVTRLLDESGDRPFRHVVVDESQDFGPAELRLCRALAPEGADDLFFAGDSGQRIYMGRFSWLSQGVDVRGRSACLRINYRTTEQIRTFADQVLPEILAGLDEDEERSSFSVLTGVAPTLRVETDPRAESTAIASIIEELLERGYAPGEIGVFARIRNVLEERAEPALRQLGLPFEPLKSDDPPTHTRVALGSMHIAKGLEFRAVIVVGCDVSLVPLEVALEKASDAAELDSLLDMEKHLLYVAATRAREELFLTSSGRPSPFLQFARGQ